LAEAGPRCCSRSSPEGGKAAVIITTNLPFSEWTTVFPNARLCKAMLDRLTDQAHIIEPAAIRTGFADAGPATEKKQKETRRNGSE